MFTVQSADRNHLEVARCLRQDTALREEPVTKQRHPCGKRHYSWPVHFATHIRENAQRKAHTRGETCTLF
jgi:hypothetical protein